MQEPEEEFVEFTPVNREVQYAEFVPDEEEEELEISLEDMVVLERKAKDTTQSGNHALAIQTWKKLSKHGSTYDSWIGLAVL